MAEHCRQFGVDLRERCRKAEEVLEITVDEKNRMVRGAELSRNWRPVHGEALPEIISHQWCRTLAPALQAGRVRRAQKNKLTYYAPDGRSDLSVPEFTSRRSMVREALRRAVARYESAVLAEAVQEVIKNADDLEYDADYPLTTCLSGLVRTGEARRVHHYRRRKGRVYWTTLEGPTSIRPIAEHPLDTRWRAIHGLWKKSGGQPFTTRAVRRYAERHPSMQIENDTVHGLTNAMQGFRLNGELARFQEDESRFVRWAPAEEWEELSEQERRRRLTQERGRGLPWISDPDDRSATFDWANLEDRLQEERQAAPDSAVDVGYLSRNQNIRGLIKTAKLIQATNVEGEQRRRLLASRPVTIETIREATEIRPTLAPDDDTSLAATLSQASKVNEEMVRPAIEVVGRVRNRCYRDLKITEAGTAYVEFESAMADVRLRRRRRRFDQLTRVFELAHESLIPLAERIRAAQLERFVDETESVRTRVEAARKNARLLEEEDDKAQTLIRQLSELLAQTDRLRDSLGTHPDSPASSPSQVEPIDVKEAYRELEAADVQYELSRPRALPRMFSLVRLIRRAGGAEWSSRNEDGPGRHVETYLDRPSYACYAMRRWGGPNLSAYAGLAFHALGGCRRPAPYIETLCCEAEVASHGPAAAALGVLDSREARTALTRYLQRVLRDGSGTSYPAAEAAILGLAPFPYGRLADGLRSGEEEVLEECEAEASDERLRRVASRTLAAWREGWDRERLLHL